MEKTALEERRAQAEQEFNALEKTIQEAQNRQAELRGQYQLLGEQLAALDQPVVSPTPDTIDVEKAVKAKK